MSESISTPVLSSKARPRLSSHRRVFLFPFLAALAILIFLLELGIGSVHIPISGVVSSLFGLEGADSTWTKIINELRLPRTIAAAIGGAALGTA
ncbi:MAG: iron chelate uptake ABC transporter family permease subunit, partial [Bacteroidota bacterium]